MQRRIVFWYYSRQKKIRKLTEWLHENRQRRNLHVFSENPGGYLDMTGEFVYIIKDKKNCGRRGKRGYPSENSSIRRTRYERRYL